MSEQSTSKRLGDVFNSFEINQIFTEAVKQMSGEAPFYIENFEYKSGDKTYLIKPERVDHDELIKKGRSSCRTCFGKGYFVSNLLRSKYPDPSSFLEIKPEHTMPENLSEEQKKIWMEREKKQYDECPTWRIMNICSCALKSFAKSNPNVMYNQAHTLFIDFDYEEIESKEEPVVEETKS